MSRSVKLGGKVIPDSIFVKLPYTQTKEMLTNQIGAAVYWTLRGNNPGDPEYSTTLNYSAYGWPYWSQLYKKCVCYGSSISVRWTNDTQNESTGVGREQNRVGWFCDTDTIFPTLYVDRLIHPRVGKWRNLNSITAGYGNSIKIPKTYVSNAKALGVSKAKSRVDPTFEFPTDLSIYPGSEWYYHLWAKEQFGGGSHTLVDFTVTYYCKFFEPKDDAWAPTQPPDTPNNEELINPAVDMKARPDPTPAPEPPPEEEGA